MSASPPNSEEYARLGSEVFRSGATECPRCGSPVLHAVPGRTTVEEVRAFARQAGWTEIESDGWIHPGCYCLGGCFGVMAEYEPSLFLVAAGPHRHAVILKVKELLRLSLREARALVDGGDSRLLEYRGWHECQRLGTEFEKLGATVRVGF
jgi:Ribosomal protein L7/L12 C-terminal domain